MYMFNKQLVSRPLAQKEHEECFFLKQGLSHCVSLLEVSHFIEILNLLALAIQF